MKYKGKAIDEPKPSIFDNSIIGTAVVIFGVLTAYIFMAWSDSSYEDSIRIAREVAK